MSDILDRVVARLFPCCKDVCIKVVFVTECAQLRLWMFAHLLVKDQCDVLREWMEKGGDVFGSKAD